MQGKLNSNNKKMCSSWVIIQFERKKTHKKTEGYTNLLVK